MTQPYKKKLIDVALPLAAINAASAREKSIRHGHPSTLHLWWARRPLAACRAVLFAQLVDDPSSHPDRFPTEAAVAAERKRLFALIEQLVQWENSTNEAVLAAAQAEIRKSCGDDLPAVYDPFSGGGSIPLEAQRLGLPAYGSDLNPVAVMIGKAMIEIPPKFKDQPPIHPGPKDRQFYRNAEGLAEDVKHYGAWMRERALARIGHLYPMVDLPEAYGGGQATVIAWIWARTVPSPDPAFADVHVPLASSFLLSSKKGKEAWVQPLVDRTAKTIRYQILTDGTAEEIDKAKKGTSAGKQKAFRCLMSGAAISYDCIRSAGKDGLMGETLLAIVAEGARGRSYVAPSDKHEFIARSEKPNRRPETRLPNNLRDFKTPNYGMKTFGDLFTDRQLVALNTFSDLVHEARAQIERDALSAGKGADPHPLREGGLGAKAYAEAVSVYLAFATDRASDAGSSIATWSNSGFIRFTFARQAIPMTWDFAECNFFSDSTGNFIGAVDWVWKSLQNLIQKSNGIVEQADAQTAAIPDNTIISTDPPYYDNIGYADLSDFFFCWLKPTLKEVFPDVFGVLTTPKTEELIAAPYRHGGKEEAERHFLDGMKVAMENMVRQSWVHFPTTIYYAFKQSEISEGGLYSPGWATFLQAILESGFSIHATWPIRTEKPGRMIAVGTNALASSVVLVCRKRASDAATITRDEFLRALKHELPAAMTELQAANLSPADMPQSAIGPGMGIFSRYAAVLERDDSPMHVKTALQLINAELDSFLTDVQGDFDPETRFAITWFAQHGYGEGDFGTANSLALARGISVESVQHAGLVKSAAGKVRLLRREEMEADWDPDADPHLTIWECCQHLIRTLEDDEASAAALLKKIGAERGENTKELAYLLYDLAAKKRGEAKEGTAYNGLIAVWGDLVRQAASLPTTPAPVQQTLNL